MANSPAKAGKHKRRDELPPDKLPTQEIIDELLAEARKPLDLPEDMAPGEQRRQKLIRLRNIVIIEALLSSGMPVSELVRLERGHLLYNVRGASVKYAKGKKEREVLVSDSAWKAIQSYLRARQDGAQPRALADLPVFSRKTAGRAPGFFPCPPAACKTSSSSWQPALAS